MGLVCLAFALQAGAACKLEQYASVDLAYGPTGAQVVMPQ
jgi:hypothetical protein